MSLLIYGVQPVRLAFQAHHVLRVYLARTEGGLTQEIQELAKHHRVPLLAVSKEDLWARTKSEQHQGVAAEIEFKHAESNQLPDICAQAEQSGERPLFVLLDGVEDPQNLGAIVRSAYGMGAHAVVIEAQRAAQVNATVIKTSAGAALLLPIVVINNLKHAIRTLKELGLWAYAATMQGQPLATAHFDEPVQLVLGAEGKGLRPTVASLCDGQVAIPLQRSFESLNVSVAAAILLYEVQRRRQAS